MHEEETFQWRCQRFGKWFITRFHCTEEHIRKEHPEAVRIESSMVVRMVPSTPQEQLQAMMDNSTSGTSKAKKGPDGRYLKVWEK